MNMIIKKCAVSAAASDQQPKQHFDLGEALGLMDFETCGEIVRRAFYHFEGRSGAVERALGDFMLDMLTEEFGYTEISPPLLVKDEIMFGTGAIAEIRRRSIHRRRTKSRDELLRDALNYADGSRTRGAETGRR